MQFQVPQNITMEDRIVGPLTLIQFSIVVVGGGIAFMMFTQTSWPSWLSYGLTVFFALLTILLALGKFNDQPMYRFFRYIIAFIITPKVRVWHKGGPEVALVRPTPVKNTEDANRQIKHVTRRDIAGLAKVLDSRGQSGSLPTQDQPRS